MRGYPKYKEKKTLVLYVQGKALGQGHYYWWNVIPLLAMPLSKGLAHHKDPITN
jgi:hypothetical protein